jgi:hypothetical protein
VGAPAAQIASIVVAPAPCASCSCCSGALASCCYYNVEKATDVPWYFRLPKRVLAMVPDVNTVRSAEPCHVFQSRADNKLLRLGGAYSIVWITHAYGAAVVVVPRKRIFDEPWVVR